MSDAKPPAPAGPLSIPPAMLDDLRVLVSNGTPILAIKKIRDALGCGLADAKRLLEENFGPMDTRLIPQPDGTVQVTMPIMPTMPIKVVHGVALDDFALAPAVRHVVNDNRGAAVEDVSARFGLSATEAEEVLHQLIGDGPPITGTVLGKDNKLMLVRAAKDRTAKAAPRFERGFVLPTAPAKPKPAVFDGAEEDTEDPVSEAHLGLGGTLLTMPSATHPSGVRRVSLDDIDAVFALLEQQVRQSGEEMESFGRTVEWMGAELERLYAIESAFLAVNEVCPPSDWLRDLKARLYDVEKLNTLRDAAQRTRLAQLEADLRRDQHQTLLPFVTTTPAGSGSGWVVLASPTDTVLAYNVGTDPEPEAEPEAEPDPKNCTTCMHAGAYTCDLLGAMRSEALTWRASNTTGKDCPGWEGKGASEASPPVAESLTELRPDWLPEGWTHRLGHYYGPDGEKVFTHGGAHACAWGSRHSDIEAWTDWTEYDKRALVLALADPKAVIQAADTRTRAESWLLSDECEDMTAYGLGAHEAAMHILRGEGTGPDPRTTMREELVRCRTTIAGMAQILEQRVATPPGEKRSIAELGTCAFLTGLIESEPAALNFLETGWGYLGTDGIQRHYTATIQHREGQTPGQMIGELKAKLVELEHANEGAAKRILALEQDLQDARSAVATAPLYVCECGAALDFDPLDQDQRNLDRLCSSCWERRGYTTLQPVHVAQLQKAGAKPETAPDPLPFSVVDGKPNPKA